MSGALPGRLLPLVLALAAPAASAQDSLRCAGGLVSVGDSKLDLLGKCGSPALVEAWLEAWQAASPAPPAPGRLLVSVSAERWTYDFGRNQFVGYVTLDAGKIVAIERGSYGYAPEPGQRPPPPIPRARCDAAGFHAGDSTFDVLSRCGTPATRDVRLERRPVWTDADGLAPWISAWRTVTVEVWSYDFGPRAFLRFLTFTDGKLEKVETGSYGYAP